MVWNMGEGKHYRIKKSESQVFPHVPLSYTSFAKWKSRGKLTHKEEHKLMHVTFSKQFSLQRDKCKMHLVYNLQRRQLSVKTLIMPH